MKVILLLVPGVLVMSALDIRADDKQDVADNAKLILGKWIVAKPNEVLSVGDYFEFDKGGKLHVQVTLKNEMPQSADMVYRVEGKEILLGFMSECGRAEAADSMTIKTISKLQLTLVLKDKTEIEFKRAM